MKKIFFFRNISAQHVKVSHGPFIGMPSISGLTGLSRNFCIQMAKSLDLKSSEFQPTGAMLGFEDYHLHEGYKKRHKSGKTIYESVPAAWASFTAHIAIEIEAASDRAAEVLSGAALNDLAVDILSGMSLCKGSLRNITKPADLRNSRLERYRTDREKVMTLMPSRSFVIRDCSYIVSDMRVAGLRLMDGMIASTLRHIQRPMHYQRFFESDLLQAQDWRLAPVMNGYLKLEAIPSGESVRIDEDGKITPSTVASPSFTLSRLQMASSIRIGILGSDNPDGEMMTFWREMKSSEGYFNHAA